jgi:hypothetical protein
MDTNESLILGQLANCFLIIHVELKNMCRLDRIGV